MKSIKLSIVGPGLSGRRTILDWLVRRKEGKIALSCMTSSATFEFETENATVAVQAEVSVFRAWLHREPGEQCKDPRIVREIQLIRESDAFVFVVDSQIDRMESNRHQLDVLAKDLSPAGLDLDSIPMVFLLNKRDLPGVVDAHVLRASYSTRVCTYSQTCALTGEGVAEGLRALIELIDRHRSERH